MKHTMKCMYCGRFVKNDDLSNGNADIELVPDTHFTFETIEVYHVKCRVKTDGPTHGGSV